MFADNRVASKQASKQGIIAPIFSVIPYFYRSHSESIVLFGRLFCVSWGDKP